MMKSIGTVIASFSERHERWFAAGTLLLLGLLAYTPLIHKFGFYRDDWYMLWVGRASGPPGIIDLFAFDRPFVGYIYSLSYRLLGEHPLHWQIYSLSIRILGAMGLMWMLRRLWPSLKTATSTAAILFLIYPGFLQWANANTKSNHLTTITLAVLSICLTVAAIQASKTWHRVLLTLGALTSAIGYWFLYEYMIGLEGLRFAVIALLAWRENGHFWKTSLRRIMGNWSPYLLFLILHVGWRLMFFESGRQGMDVDLALSAYQSGTIRIILKRLMILGIDIFEAFVSAWVVPLNNLTSQLESTDILIGGLLSLLGMAIFGAFFLLRNKPGIQNSKPEIEEPELKEFLVVGAVATLSALIPVVVVGRDIRWVSGFDKYTLHASVGVAMLLVGAISLLVKSRLKVLPLTMLIGTALATQYSNSIDWAHFWEDQRQLWWQMSWRVPQLQDGTVLLVETPGQGFYEDYEIWGPANLVYHPTGSIPRIYSEIYTHETLEKIRVGTTEVRGLREVLEFTRSYHDSLIISRPERTSCWHIIDGQDPTFPGRTSAMLYSTFRRSNIDQIDSTRSPAVPPPHIFGNEPEHSWCYYFQLASLEAQRGNWDEISNLTDQALAAGFKPIDRSEWIPFLKGLVMVGRDTEAEEVALWIRDIPTIRHRQCDYLSDTALPDPSRQTYLRDILCH